jgi:hypothetical protein
MAWSKTKTYKTILPVVMGVNLGLSLEGEQGVSERSAKTSKKFRP